MLNFIKNPLGLFRKLFVVAFPMLAGKASDDEGGQWSARVLILTTGLVVLGLLNNWKLLNLADQSAAREPINRFWLPLLAFLLYAGLWAIWWLWRLLHFKTETVSDFPDIDEAWKRATEALSKAGIHLDTTPLYLILGRNSDADESIHQASGLKPLVNQVPGDPNSPLRVSADREGIWLTCPGTSLMGHVEATPEVEMAAEPDPFNHGEPAGNPFATVAGGIHNVLDVIKNELAKGRPAARSTIDVERAKARLNHLCRLIVRDRQGFCPINGVLLLIPITSVDQGRDLGELARSCRIDLTVAFEAFRMRCPVLALVCGLEALPGFAEFVDRLPAARVDRRNRFGQRYPLVPDLAIAPSSFPDAETLKQSRHRTVSATIKSSVEWVSETTFTSLIYSLFGSEAPGGEDVKDVVEGNARLYQFLSRIQACQERLGQAVADCLPHQLDEPIMFGGCYFAATGSDPAREHVFVQGVFRRLVEDQDKVTWTEEALAEDDRQRRRARVIGNVLTGSLILAVLWIAYLILRKALQG